MDDPKVPRLRRVSKESSDPTIRGVSGATWRAASVEEKEMVSSMRALTPQGKVDVLTELRIRKSAYKEPANENRPDPQRPA